MSNTTTTTTTTTLLSLLVEGAQENPEKLLYTHLPDHPSREPDAYSYGDLLQRSAAIARQLRKTIRPGDRALIIYPIGMEYLCAFFGCLLAGVIAVPVYPPRLHKRIPDSNLGRLRAIITDCEPGIALSETDTLARMRQMPLLEEAGIPYMDSGLISDDSSALPWLDLPTSDQIAFLQYTSGSTAVSRGVKVSHDNLYRNLETFRNDYKLGSDLRVVGWLPLYHDMGLIGQILAPLFNRGCAYFMDPTAFLKNPLRWLEELTRYQATVSITPPFGLRLAMEAALEAENLDHIDLSDFRRLLVGAESIDPRLLRNFAKIFSPCGFSEEMYYPCYGLAEATLSVSGGKNHSTYQVFRARREALAADRIEPTTSDNIDECVELTGCGRVHPDFDLQIVDPETWRRSPTNRVGEIWLAGDSVASGYYNKDEANHATFRARLVETGSQSYTEYLRTGDLGFVNENELYLTGRIKETLIVNGRNHYLPDIEFTLRSRIPLFAKRTISAFVYRASGSEQLVVAVEWGRHPPKGDLSEEIQAAVELIARVHYLSVFDFLLLKSGSIPRTSSGKIQRGVSARHFEENVWQGAIYFSFRANREADHE